MRTVDPAKWSKNQHGYAKASSLPKIGLKVNGLESRLRSSLRDSMREYLKECTLGGIRYAFDVKTIRPLRKFYAILMFGLVLLGSGIVVYSWYGYGTRPLLQVNLLNGPPGKLLDFPAVGICSNSVVSEKSMHEYAMYLKEKNHNKTHTLQSIKENLKRFGALITLRSADVDSLSFMRFLYNNDPSFNVTDLMYTLSPKCSSMLSRCRWRGRSLPCEQLFATRLTQLGFCCLFNSRYQPEDIHNQPKVLDLTGQNYGLSLALVQNSDDFAVVRLPASPGHVVLLFDGRDYPLLEGGAVRAYNVGTNVSVYFQLTTHAQYAASELNRFSDKQRHCHIQQWHGPRSAQSSFSWCLTQCRRNTTEAICNCQPFWNRPSAGDTVCTTEHLYCLNKHREKFIYYYPGDVEDPGLDEELQDSLYCPQCFPDCARILHMAKVFHPTYHFPRKLLRNAATSGTSSFVNMTFIRFYYASMNHQLYRVELNSYWFEIFAAVSCQSMFLVGASLVSVAELVFHLTLRWCHHFMRRSRQVKKRKHENTYH